MSSFSVNLQLQRYQFSGGWCATVGTLWDEFEFRDFIVLCRFKIMIRYRGELSTDDISYFKLMFGMGSFPDAYGESCVSIVQFDFQGSGITQLCMGCFIERPSKTYSGLDWNYSTFEGWFCIHDWEASYFTRHLIIFIPMMFSILSDPMSSL